MTVYPFAPRLIFDAKINKRLGMPRKSICFVVACGPSIGKPNHASRSTLGTGELMMSAAGLRNGSDLQR